MLSSDSESELLALCDVGEDNGLVMFDSLDEDDAGSVGGIWSSCGVVCVVPFIAMSCVSSWSILGSVGENGPEMGLELG